MKFFGWIVIFFIVLYIIPLGSRPMMSPVEFDNAEIAREMVVSESYSTVNLLGIPAPHIPPMSYWIQAGCFNLFGVNNFSARLPFAIAAGITAILLALLIHQNLRDEKLAALASTIFMAFSLSTLVGSISVPEMMFAMAFSGIMGTIFLALQETEFNRRKFLLLVLAGLSTAFAFLTSGTVIFTLTAISVIPYMIISRKIKQLPLIIIPYLVFAAIPVIPWLIKANSFEGAVCRIFSFETFCESIGSYSWFSYPIVFAAGLFPVIILLPAALMTGKESWKRLFRQPICQFAACLLIFPLIYFIAVRNEPAGMMLISFPSAALLIAMGLQAYFNNGGHHRSFDWMLNIWAAFLVICGTIEVCIWFFHDRFAETVDLLILTPVAILITGVVSLIGGGVLLYSLRGNWRSRLYLFFFSISILPLGFSWCIKPSAGMPEKYLSELIKQNDILPENTVFFTSEKLVRTVAWCAKEGEFVIIDNDTVSQLPAICKERPFCVILKQDDPAWDGFYKYSSLFRFRTGDMDIKLEFYKK